MELASRQRRSEASPAALWARLYPRLLLHPAALRAAPLVCLTAILFLLLFPWVGVYAGGRAVLTQSGYGVAFNSVARHVAAHPELEARLRTFFSVDPNLRPGVGGWTLLYFLAVLAGLLVGAAWLAAPHVPWPPARRPAARGAPAVAGIGLAALMLLAGQLAFGFPLENLVAAQMAKDNAEQRKNADQADDGAERQARAEWVEIQSGVKESMLRRGAAVWFTVLVNLLAVGTALAAFWRERRAAAAPLAPQAAGGRAAARLEQGVRS